MRGSLRTIALTATPAAAVVTLALGLRIGARSEIRAAVVFAAPPSAEARGLAWQVLVVREERGVRDTLPGVPLVVESEVGGSSRTWRGATNADGVAEAWIDAPDVKAGDAIRLRVRADGEPADLASGTARVDAPWDAGRGRGRAAATPSRREGRLTIDVATLGGALVPGFPTDVWIGAFDAATHAPVDRARIDVEPEPGLAFEAGHATACRAGYARFRATAMAHVTGARFTARAPDGRTGEWFGALSVAGGAMDVQIPQIVEPGAPFTITVSNPTPRPIGYVEIDDERGRAWARTLSFTPDDRGVGRAGAPVPPLALGLHWIVTASEPHGAATLAGAAVARPFLVGRSSAGGDAECEDGARLAHEVSGGFPWRAALNGIADARARADAGRRRGATFAAIGIAAAAVLEALLILAGARRSHSDLLAMERELDGDDAASADDEKERARLVPPGAALRVAIGLALAMLGFALLASLALYRAG